MAPPGRILLGTQLEPLLAQVDAVAGQLKAEIASSLAGLMASGLPRESAIKAMATALRAEQEARWRPMLNALDSTYNSAVQAGYTSGIVDAHGDEILAWQAVGDGSCRDCLGRDGQTGTVDEWLARGMPATRWPQGGPVCCSQTIRCRCVLVPSGAKTGGPLIREPDPARPGRTRPRG